MLKQIFKCNYFIKNKGHHFKTKSLHLIRIEPNGSKTSYNLLKYSRIERISNISQKITL